MNIYKSFSVYLITSFIDKGLSFLLLPIFTYYLAPADYGMLSLITTLFVFLTPVVSLGTTSAISVAYFSETKSDYASYVTSSLLVPALVTVLLFVLCIVFGHFFSIWLGISRLWITVIPVFSFMSLISAALLVDYQIKKEPLKYGAFSLSGSLVNIGISLFMVIALKMNYQGRLLGQYGEIVLYAIIAVVLLKKREILTFKLSKKFCIDSLMFGLPILPHVIGCMVISMSDRLFINQISGKAELGIYNTGYAIGGTISMLSAAFANAIVPFSYERFAKGDEISKEKVVKVYWLYILALLIIVISLSLLAPYIFEWFINKRFRAGVVYVKWISLGYFFQGCYLLFANIIYYTKKTKILFYWSIINVTLNLGLNYLLINKFGTIGAAYTLCVSYFVFFISIAIISYKIYPLPWFYFLKRRVA